LTVYTKTISTTLLKEIESGHGNAGFLLFRRVAVLSFRWRWFLWGFQGWFVGKNLLDCFPQLLRLNLRLCVRGVFSRHRAVSFPEKSGSGWHWAIQICQFGRLDFSDNTISPISNANGQSTISAPTSYSIKLRINPLHILYSSLFNHVWAVYPLQILVRGPLGRPGHRC